MTAGLPDLVVQIKTPQGAPFTAEVRNIGSAGSAPTKLEVRIGQSVEQLPVPAVAPGKTVTIPFGHPGKGVDLSSPVQVHVDKPPIVQELDEGNNTASLP